MGTATLIVEVKTKENIIPLSGATVKITPSGGGRSVIRTTDMNGATDPVSLPAPDISLSLHPETADQAVGTCDVEISKSGYIPMILHNEPLLDTRTFILPISMEPLPRGARDNLVIEVTIPPNNLQQPAPRSQIGREDLSRLTEDVYIPQYMRVKLGAYTNASARVVKVPFIDYITNVTCSEIYSTWPYNSILANIHVIVTFALNRVYTEWYPSRGYNFDITSDTATDMKYREDVDIDRQVAQMVNLYFNTYIHRAGYASPAFTSFCDGIKAQCAGLKQWETVTLANQGYTPLQMIQRFYGADYVLGVTNNIHEVAESYPGYALSEGARGEDVRRIQTFLNQIRVYYPAIPETTVDGVYGASTKAAVKAFQQIFGLSADGVVGKSTWNAITRVYTAIRKMGEIGGGGDRVDIDPTPPKVTLSQGSRGEDVIQLQFILNTLAKYYPDIPYVNQDGSFGAGTKDAVIAFQRLFGLPADGVVGAGTWNALYAAYRGIGDNVVDPGEPGGGGTQPYPGTVLKLGSTGASVRRVQEDLAILSRVYPDIPNPGTADGVFGAKTQAAVIAFQKHFGLTPDGMVGSATWNALETERVKAEGGGGGGGTPQPYPGTALRLGSTGSAVRRVQEDLAILSRVYPDIPNPGTADGVFGAKTQAAVIAFQKRFGLTPDGIVGPATWDALEWQRHVNS